MFGSVWFGFTALGTTPSYKKAVGVVFFSFLFSHATCAVKIDHDLLRQVCYDAAMKILLTLITLLWALSPPLLAKAPDPEQAPDVEQVTEPAETNVPAKGFKLPNIPDYLAPNEKALFSNAYGGDLKGVQVALAKGAAINIADQKKRTALMLAASNGHTAVVKYLVDQGADVNARDGDNQTPLMYASRRSFNKTAAVLLKSGADVNVQSKKEGISALMLAAIWNNVELANMFLDHGADANLTDRFGRTAKVLAQKKGNADVVNLLSDPPVAQ